MYDNDQDDPEQRSRSEDDLIAYTWRWYIDRRAAGEDFVPEEVILRMPMTKVSYWVHIEMSSSI